MATRDTFLWAVRKQESGGNYSSVNSSSGALGAYQVMPSNVASWTKRSLGHSLTAAQFLADPAAQDAVASTILGGYYDQYGAAGAASVWYSGQPDPTKTYGSPPVWQYVKDVLQHMGTAPSVLPAGSTTPAVADGGGTVRTAGLQQAGYDAVINLTPWGIPLNPFKLPGWLGGKLGELGGDAAGGALGGFAWDTLGPIVLATLGVGAGVALAVLGVYVTAKPAVDSGLDTLGKVNSIK